MCAVVVVVDKEGRLEMEEWTEDGEEHDEDWLDWVAISFFYHVRNKGCIVFHTQNNRYIGLYIANVHHNRLCDSILYNKNGLHGSYLLQQE